MRPTGGMNKHRYYILYHWALQYDDWKCELETNTDTVAAVAITDMPTSHNVGDPTGRLAERRAELSHNMAVVDSCVLSVAGDKLYPFIIKAVTEEGCSYELLKNRYHMPCSRNSFLRMRREFYEKLSENVKIM